MLLVSAGVRAAPGALLTPLQDSFGWSRGSISLVVAVSILTYGIGGPVAGSLIDRFGPRRVAVGGLVVIAAGLAPLVFLTEEWQFFVLWGVVVGVGTGAVSSVLGATVATRWFRTHRGMVVGLFAAASSAGQLVFLPTFVTVIEATDFRVALGGAALITLALAVPALLFLRDRPSDVGRRSYGDDGSAAHARAEQAEAADGMSLRQAMRSADFWLLAGSFFVCGYTSNGLIGTHLISHAIEHGFTPATAAGAVGVMGMMNVFGTLASGWATDRFDNRKLLAAYYGFRALSITWLPAIDATGWLFLFAIVYGLDWIATVPPTTNLTAKLFGAQEPRPDLRLDLLQPHARRGAGRLAGRGDARLARRLHRRVRVGRAHGLHRGGDDAPACRPRPAPRAARSRRRSRRRRLERPRHGQIAEVQALHFEASTAFASLQNGHVLTGSAGSSLINDRLMRKTTAAMTMNAITTLMNAPHRIATSLAGSALDWSTILSCEKSTPPRSIPTGGMMMSSTSELTTLPRATPMMIAMARAMAFVLSRNARNSPIIWVLLLLCWHWRPGDRQRLNRFWTSGGP